MNEVATQSSGGAVAANQGNYFEAYGDQASQKSIVGTLLKFDKGDYLAGKDNDVIEVGTQMIANMDQLLVGWIRWSNGKPTEQIMGAVTKGFQPPKRNTLGDNDEAEWDTDDKTGVPKDPWSFANYLVLKDPEDDDGLYTFTTSSRGGLNAIGELCKAYGKVMRAKPNDYPIVQLRVDSYVHTQYGRIKVPQLVIVGWAPKTVFDDVGEVQADEATLAPAANTGLDDGPELSASQQLKPADSSGRAPRGSSAYAKPGAATKF